MARAEELGATRTRWRSWRRSTRSTSGAGPGPSTWAGSCSTATTRASGSCVWGAAFKPNSDDIRDSPALDVAAAVQKLGAAVIVYDPEAMDNAKRAYPQLAMASSALEAARDADVVLLLTEWAEFREMDPAKLASVVAAPRIVDGRNALDPAILAGRRLDLPGARPALTRAGRSARAG